MAFFHVVLAIIITLAPLNANIIRGNTTAKYNHLPIYCSPGEDCTVICDHTSACYFSDIYCPTNHTCDIQCLTPSDTTGRESCKTAKFHCQNSDQCNILCQSDTDQAYTCESAIFNWPINNQYSLTCSGGRSCYDITIDAPDNNQEFNFNCTGGEGTCFYSTINCPDNADCNILCVGPYACHSVIVNCPLSINSQCNIYCDGLEACQNTKFFRNGVVTCTGDRVCVNSKFPRPPADEDLYINCLQQESCYNANITCPTNANCVITCNGYNACSNAKITWPTGNGEYITSITCDSDTACSNVLDPPSGPKIIESKSTYTPTSTTTTSTTTSITTSATNLYGVTISLSFNYTANITSEDIDDILSIIIANIIEQGIIDKLISNGCGNYQINVNVDHLNNSGTASINATVPLCNQQDVDKLISYFKSELESDLIEEIEADPQIRLIAILDVQIEQFEQEVITPSTSYIITTENNNNEASNNDGIFSDLFIMMIVIIVCLLVLIALLLYFLYKRILKKNDSKENGICMQELQEGNDIVRKQGENVNNDITTIGDEQEGLYTNKKQDMITPVVDDDDDDMYLNSGHVTPNIAQQIDTPGQKSEDNILPDLPPIGDEFK